MKKVITFLTLVSFLYSSKAQWTTSGSHIYNSNAGNVGIGTSTPAAKLHVNGYLNATRIVLYEEGDNVLCSSQGSNFYQLIGTYSGWDSKAVYLAAYNAGNAAAGQHNMVTERVYIGSPTFNGNFLSVNLMNGGVGIGTSVTGSFRLAVEGKIGAREVRVTNASPWPDYVFSKHYKLKDLYSLEAYIRQHNHLPNIPSAKEVQDNGIELGKMNAQLLEKIEELTLYVIDLRKEIDRLKAEKAHSATATDK